MDSRITVYWCIICVYLVQYATCMPCDEVNLTISTNQTDIIDGSFMALVDDPIYIQCKFTCDACTKQYMYWRKDGQVVYSKTWSSNTSVSGPEPGFRDKVFPSLIEDELGGIYVMQWLKANWTDLPPGRMNTTWDCLIGTDTCAFKLAKNDVKYHRYPELLVFLDGHEWREEGCDDIKNETVMVNCTALAQEGSQLTLWHGDKEKSGDCYVYDYESFCLVSDHVTISDGFNCTVSDTQFSEERGCDKVISQQTTDEGLPPWAITLIVLGVAGATTAAVFGGVYIKKKMNNASGSVN